MESYNEIEDWIICELNKFSIEYCEHNKRSATFATYSIKEIVGNYGTSRGFEVCASGFPDHFHNEWLYDLVWFKENESKNLISVELVLESEMNYGLPAIKFDFEKLLLSNSNYRIMICPAGKIPIETIKNYCTEAVSGYTNLKKGERILTLIWDDFESGEFIPHLAIK